MIVSGDGGAGGTPMIDGERIEQAENLPSLDEVLANYVKAMGGTEAIKAPTSRVVKGKLDVVGVSRGGSFETYAQAPDKTLTVIQANPIGTIKVGYNGRSGWELSARGSRGIKGVELASLQRDSDFYFPLNLKQNFAKVTLLGKSRIGYREVYVLELHPGAGSVGNSPPASGKSRTSSGRKAVAALGPAEKLYLDAKTYLPVRMNAVRTMAVPSRSAGQSRNPIRQSAIAGQVAVPIEIYFDDWRTVDGIKYPFRISQAMGTLTLSFIVNEIRHNLPVAGNLFELPR
jgi:hypothetical protein